MQVQRLHETPEGETVDVMSDTAFDAIHKTYALKINELTESNRQLREELEKWKASAGFCEKHQPTGGHRNCLVCGCEKLSFALSKISYALGKPNEMGVSDYCISYEEDAVVEKVKSLTTALAAARELVDRLVKSALIADCVKEPTVDFWYCVR